MIYYSSNLNNTSTTFNDDVYNYAYKLIGGDNTVSTFGLSNMYEDIDAIYLANHLSEKPIDILVKEYYKELKKNRKQIFTDSVLKSGKSLFESVYEEFTGYNGLKRPGSTVSGLGKFILKGIKNNNNISKESAKKLYDETYVGVIYKITIQAFVDKINSIDENGFLN
ncbi:hypothetical protein [uncultured Clostridium sp.]|uniref:hypothetical protein n=1 Tax=uncultured Clostridium sp. TaxID=59620 RepID=UPI002639FB4A|nr:hypothetical protein [uncultured Clostridium sp.]